MKYLSQNFRTAIIRPISSFLLTLLFINAFVFSWAQDFIKITQENVKIPPTSFSPKADLNVNRITLATKVHPDWILGFESDEEAEANNLTVINAFEGESHFLLETGFEGAVRIKNAVNGKYLEIDDDMAIHGGLIGQGERRNHSSQQFQLVSLGDGYYSIVSHLNYNLALEVDYQGAGSALILKTRKRNETQAFKLINN